MPREHANYIQGQFETPFGPMDFTLTSGVHVHVSAGADGDQSPKIVVNRIPYYTSAHLILNEEGWTTQYQIHTSREGSGEEASRATEAKASRGIIEAWTAFINENEYLMVEGEIVGLNNEIYRIEGDIDELKKQIDKKAEEVEGLEYREQEAYKARSLYTRKGGYPKPKDWSPTGELPEE